MTTCHERNGNVGVGHEHGSKQHVSKHSIVYLLLLKFGPFVPTELATLIQLSTVNTHAHEHLLVVGS